MFFIVCLIDDFKMRPRRDKSVPVVNINDIKVEERDKEIVFIEGDDEFEMTWSQKRASKGSILVSLDSTDYPLKPKKPSYLTKLGHGCYVANELAMICFMGGELDDYSDDNLIEKMKNYLTHFGSLERINLYACKSGLVPMDGNNKSLVERKDLIKNDPIPGLECRYHYGLLSYAEYFIVKLQESYKASGLPFPNGLSVVACLGDVKDNNGKPGVSGSKRILFYKENYAELDLKTNLVKIDCDKFLIAYHKILAPVDLNRNRDHFFLTKAPESSEDKEQIDPAIKKPEGS
jgi:hypothetical protein